MPVKQAEISSWRRVASVGVEGGGAGVVVLLGRGMSVVSRVGKDVVDRHENLWQKKGMNLRQPHSRFQALARVVRLRCPACGIGPLFRGLFAMAPECGRCGYSYRREPGFYLGSIYINYGVTAICTILLYALLVMGLGASHERALVVSVVVAVVLPVVFFRWARALLLALDNSVNANQSHGASMTAEADAGTKVSLNYHHLRHLKADDGSAGCAMGIALALILLFGLLMGGVTLYFVMSQPVNDSTSWEDEQRR